MVSPSETGTLVCKDLHCSLGGLLTKLQVGEGFTDNMQGVRGSQIYLKIPCSKPVITFFTSPNIVLRVHCLVDTFTVVLVLNQYASHKNS